MDRLERRNMYMETEADRTRNEAIQRIREAINLIFSIVNEDVDGLNKYNKEYRRYYPNR